MNALIQSAETVLLKSIGAKAGEKILIVYDDTTAEIAGALEEAARKHGLTASSRMIEKPGRPAVNPDSETCEMMKQSDIVIGATYYSLTHCQAVRDAAKTGARVATLPGIDRHLFSVGFAADSSELADYGNVILGLFRGKKHVHITSAKGTDLTFTIAGVPFTPDNAMVDHPGEIGNLPGGEVYTAPDAGSANGKICFDGSIGSFVWHDGDEPAYIEVKDGRAVKFSGARGLLLEKELAKSGDSGFVLAEFGIGTNTKMKFSGNLLGDEKLAGTIHLAFGDNRSFGGTNAASIHIDGLVFAPTVEADGEVVMKEGKPVCPR